MDSIRDASPFSVLLLVAAVAVLAFVWQGGRPAASSTGSTPVAHTVIVELADYEDSDANAAGVAMSFLSLDPVETVGMTLATGATTITLNDGARLPDVAIFQLIEQTGNEVKSIQRVYADADEDVEATSGEDGAAAGTS